MKKALLSLMLWAVSLGLMAAPLLVDVRTAEEFAQGHAAGAVQIEYQQLGAQLQQQGVALDQPIYLYCRSGRRAQVAADELQRLGYQQVVNLGSLAQAIEWQAAQATAE